MLLMMMMVMVMTRMIKVETVKCTRLDHEFTRLETWSQITNYLLFTHIYVLMYYLELLFMATRMPSTSWHELTSIRWSM